MKKICLKISIFLLCSFLFFSCKNDNEKLLILWTDNVEFALYTEQFNTSQKDIKIATVYKADLLNSLPPKKGTKKPDIIVGSYLAPGIQKNQFKSLNSVFNDTLTPELFYSDLLNFGKKGHRQVLLPVSFNLDAMVYDIENQKYLEQTTTITIDEIKEISKTFNLVGKDNVYKKMAFAPQWNPHFLYKILDSNEINFSIKNDNLIFNIPVYENTCAFINDWTSTINTSFSDEKDFSFKYLYTPFNKQILQNKSLFSYTTSDKILSLPEDELSKIDFKWFLNKGKSTVQENIVMMGIYKRSNNKKDAIKFIRWFMEPKNQESFLSNRLKMKLDTSTFGIANGFSSLININEQILPIYYRPLLAKIPNSTFPSAPKIYSKEWDFIKNEIIIPHLLLQLEGKTTPQELSKSFNEWINSTKEE